MKDCLIVLRCFATSVCWWMKLRNKWGKREWLSWNCFPSVLNPLFGHFITLNFLYYFPFHSYSFPFNFISLFILIPFHYFPFSFVHLYFLYPLIFIPFISSHFFHLPLQDNKGYPAKRSNLVSVVSSCQTSSASRSRGVIPCLCSYFTEIFKL